ncbi:glycosyltransferase involved in cell wall biosynthesis [Fontibacillus phaseoli]|uniref:Glycosyltransferase involved in cell wall biosynthesis n=2 Tax=Fontibacillus phaseoli TaxID=1416533 RepID=A0A369B730_9BACL|nr:glycosyltransferase involved in cell wall biosynthesis [Fontibacillus phaseoli]
MEDLRGDIVIGYVGGRPKRVNEKAIDEQWISYLGQYADVVKIPPLAFIKLFDGSIEQWIRRYPYGMPSLSEKLSALCSRYRINVLYINLPVIVPYLLLARNYIKSDLSFLLIAHSVASPFWLKQWLAIVPSLATRDILLVSSSSCRQALLNISAHYDRAEFIPLCISLQNKDRMSLSTQVPATGNNLARQQLLAIGRIENVKNTDFLLHCFAKVHTEFPQARLTIAGEYTGATPEQMAIYRHYITGLVEELDLEGVVVFPGIVEGEAKEKLFMAADLLVNFSTDPGETFGFNLLEAKAWGIPVVCTNWDGFRELVDHGHDGFLVDCCWENDYPTIDLAQAVSYCLQILSDGCLRESMSRAAKQSAQKYDYQVIVPKIVEAIYRRFGEPCDPVVSKDAIFNTPLSFCPDIYHLHHLQQFSFINDSLFSILRSPNDEPMEEWMPKAKPIIKHFCERSVERV